MPTELNLNSPYKVYADDFDLSYSFTTENDVVYKLAFTDFNSLFINTSGEGIVDNVYNLLIDNVEDKFAPLDPNVRETVAEILKEFFKNTKNTLVYTCDSVDHKQMVRYRKFNYWFDMSDFNANLVMLKNEFKDQEDSYYASMIYHKDNPVYDILKQSYDEIVQSLNNK
ncbi:hypothetical protein DBR28_15980 [Chryseobacterium sp. HMWF028]|nr:hypothetical protein DBR28_15980 [Chryseobacterium sp. HMWF028]